MKTYDKTRLLAFISLFEKIELEYNTNRVTSYDACLNSINTLARETGLNLNGFNTFCSTKAESAQAMIGTVCALTHTFKHFIKMTEVTVEQVRSALANAAVIETAITLDMHVNSRPVKTIFTGLTTAQWFDDLDVLFYYSGKGLLDNIIIQLPVDEIDEVMINMAGYAEWNQSTATHVQ